MIASRIASRLGINHVEYSVVWENEEPFSLCEDFITRDTELISASHIMNAFKKPNNLSEYEYYIQVRREARRGEYTKRSRKK